MFFYISGMKFFKNYCRFFYNNLGIRAVIVCSYCMLIDLIKDYKNHKNFFIIVTIMLVWGFVW